MSSLSPILSSGDPANKEKKELFRYYKKLYDDEGKFLEKAQCGFCQKSHVYRSTDNDGALWRHLKRTHSVTRSTTKPSSTTVPSKVSVKTVQNKKPHEDTKWIDKSNPIYRYFTVQRNSKAKCRVCTSASLPTPLLLNHTTAMKMHLKTHPRAFKLYELEKQFGATGPEYDKNVHQPENNEPSAVTLNADGTYHCSICRKITSGGITEVQNHFREKHPYLAGQEAGTEDVVTEVVKLGSKKKKKPIITFKPKSSKNVMNISSAKNTKSLNKISLDDDLDTFSLYIASLLRNMPKDDCTKVQQTIMNNIYKAKLNAKSEKSNKAKSIQKEDIDEDITDVEDEATEKIEIEVEGSPVTKRYKYAITEEADILELS